MPTIATRTGGTELLTGHTAMVGGDSAAAVVLRWHLAALGAAVEDGPPPPGRAAVAVLVSPSGQRRELLVDWSGPGMDAGMVDEATVQAVCGIMHVHGRSTGAPRGLGLDYCATAAGVLAVTGLLAAVLADPIGDVRIHTSVAEAALLTVSQYLAAAGAQVPGFSEDTEAVDLQPGGPPFTSSDDVVFEIETLQPETWAAFWTRLEADRAAVRAAWRPFQFRYATATAALPDALHHTMRRHGFAEIAAAGRATGVTVCRLYRADERAAELATQGRWPEPWRLDAGLAGQRRTSLGRHTACAPNPAADWAQRPLAGIVVLEAGRRIQAPLAAHMLGMLGASVVRIEPPGGDPLRGMPPTCRGLSARWLALNRGKDAVELDIKELADRDRLRGLAGTADVFLHNWAPGKAEELGLGAADLPGPLVYAYTSGFGPQPPPDAPVGTDFMVQARTGLAELVHPLDQPARPSLMTLLDVLGGLLGAEAVLAGLLRRRELNSAVSVESSLLGAANALHLPLLRTGAPARAAAGFRQPQLGAAGWLMHPDRPQDGDPVPVTTDLAALLTDPRLAAAVGRDERGCPALGTPWRIS